MNPADPFVAPAVEDRQGGPDLPAGGFVDTSVLTVEDAERVLSAPPRHRARRRRAPP